MNARGPLLRGLARLLGIAGVTACLLFAPARRDTAAAIDFSCIEASRYKNLMQAFNDNPSTFLNFFNVDASRPLDVEACRALLLTGTIRPRDAEALIDQLIRNKGWLAVLYLSFDGVDLVEEIKLAQVIRGFALKTRVLLGPSFRYEPDFASHWDAPPLMGINTANPESLEVSDVNGGLQAFAGRPDLNLRLSPSGNICLGSCGGAYGAGVNRLISPLPPVAPNSVTGPVPEIAWAPAQAQLLASLDGVKVAPPTGPMVVPGASVAALPTAPPAMQRLLRDKCGAFLAATDAVVGRVARAIRNAGSNGFHDVSVEQYKVGSALIKSLIADFGALDRAGARQQRCLAQAYEAERLASFERLCERACDKGKLVQSFERSGRAFIDADLTFAKLYGNPGDGELGQQWETQEGQSADWHGTLVRRGTTNAFDATFVNGRNQIKATVDIGRSGDRVFAVRTQREGRCLYHGVVTGRTVAGTYVCTWAQGAFGWTASIAAAPPPSP